MKVKVKFIGVPNLPPAYESPKEIPVDFSGSSAKELIYHLVRGMDSETRSLFLSDQEEISADLAVIVNGIAVSGSSRLDVRLKENDLVELVSSPG